MIQLIPDLHGVLWCQTLVLLCLIGGSLDNRLGRENTLFVDVSVVNLIRKLF